MAIRPRQYGGAGSWFQQGLKARHSTKLYLVLQIVLVGCFRCNEGVKRELCAEAKAGNKAVEGGFTVDGCPGIDILDKPFLFLAGEFIREEVLVQ